MATFTWNPDYSASVDTKPTIKTAQFGDGYILRVCNDIFPLPRKWSLSFKVSPSVADKIESFLQDKKGVTSFDWTPPRGATGKWITTEEGWKRTVEEAYDQISVMFQEVPD